MKTSKQQWNRRKLLTTAAGLSMLGTASNAGLFDWFSTEEIDLTNAKTTRNQHRGYSNYYELSTSKDGPVKQESAITVDDWIVSIDNKNLTIDELMGRRYEDLQSEWFRFRCVEAWSMIVQHNGFPLSEILEEYGDTSKKYVQFECLQQQGLPGQNRFSSIEWPYREWLHMDEAMSPICWATFGYYGEPSIVNGSPLRISSPWLYGFCQPKGVVKITCTDEDPISSWEQLAPYEYGKDQRIVDPQQSHPRWSQATERFIHSEGTSRIPTIYMNGYEL